jgi:hypothetical protein
MRASLGNASCPVDAATRRCSSARGRGALTREADGRRRRVRRIAAPPFSEPFSRRWARLFFLEFSSGRVHLAGCTANPDGLWTTQQARQLAWSLTERTTPIRFLIHDRDSKFSRAFNDVFRSEDVEIIRTPFRAPNANAFAER